MERRGGETRAGRGGSVIVIAGVVSAAALYALACPPPGWSLAAWLVPGLLLASTRRLSPFRGALAGALFAVIYGCGMTAWALHASLEYFAFNRLAAGAFVAAVWLVYGGIPFGLLVVANGLAWKRVPAPTCGLVGAWLWVGCEVLRTTLFTGMPWELLGHTQYRNLLLVQVADLGGVYAVSFVMALASVSGAELLLVLRHERVSAGTLCRHLALPATALAAVLAYGVHGRHVYGGPPPAAGARTVAVVQGNIPNAFRWKRAFFERALATYAELTSAARGARPDLIVWPEYAVNFYIDQEPMLHAELGGVAALAREGLVVGGPRLTAEGLAHNSAYLLGPDGAIRGTYDKRRLVPFAEYDPLPWFAAEASSEPVTFAAGEGPDLLETASLRLGTMICYEAVFPNLARDLVRRGADLLVNISNDSWLDRGDGAAPLQHFSMTVFRAIETRRYLVRASASGVSGFVSPFGEPYALVPTDTPGTRVASVLPMHEMTAYTRWGDAWIPVAGLIIAPVLLPRRREGLA